MRRADDQVHVRWSVDVYAPWLDDLEARFPVHGMRAWLIESGIEQFVELCEVMDPAELRALHALIADTIYNQRAPSPVKRANLNVRRNIHDRFNALFPEQGASTWFVRALVRSWLDRTANFSLDDLLHGATAAVARPRHSAAP